MMNGTRQKNLVNLSALDGLRLTREKRSLSQKEEGLAGGVQQAL
jgi:hypothetical protein